MCSFVFLLKNERQKDCAAFGLHTAITKLYELLYFVSRRYTSGARRALRRGRIDHQVRTRSQSLLDDLGLDGTYRRKHRRLTDSLIEARARALADSANCWRGVMQ